MLSVLWSGNSAAGHLLPSRTLSGVQGARPPDAAAAEAGRCGTATSGALTSICPSDCPSPSPQGTGTNCPMLSPLWGSRCWVQCFVLFKIPWQKCGCESGAYVCARLRVKPVSQHQLKTRSSASARNRGRRMLAFLGLPGSYITAPKPGGRSRASRGRCL